MTATAVPMNYISLDDAGTARVTGTGIKVRVLAEELQAGYRPEDMQEAHEELSMAQVYAALAYYYANKTLFDETIASGLRAAAETEAAVEPNVSRNTLVGRLQKPPRGTIR